VQTDLVSDVLAMARYLHSLTGSNGSKPLQPLRLKKGLGDAGPLSALCWPCENLVLAESLEEGSTVHAGSKRYANTISRSAYAKIHSS
jgi:hypothetical protein